MGTRNLTIVHVNGKYPIAQYCQWDGYPGGQGMTALRFARDKMDRGLFLHKVSKVSEISPAKLRKLWKDAGGDDSGWATMDVAEKFKGKTPQLDRDMGADVLQYIQEQPDGLLVKTQIEFAADSLFCEWAYVLDFDANTFEAYKGFNTLPLPSTERFAHMAPADHSGSEYHPIKLMAAWPLDNLPTDDEFMIELDIPEEAAGYG